MSRNYKEVSSTSSTSSLNKLTPYECHCNNFQHGKQLTLKKPNFWWSFDIRNSQAFVGFDADQSIIGGGFTLKWNARRMYEYDFTDVFEAHEFVTKEAGFLRR